MMPNTRTGVVTRDPTRHAAYNNHVTYLVPYRVGSGIKACGCLYPPGRVGSYVGVADSDRGETKLKSLAQIQVVVVVCTGKASRSARLTMVTCRAGCAFLFGGRFLSQTRLDRLAWTLNSTLYGISLSPRCRLQHGTWPPFPSCDQAITACTIYRLSADADAGAIGEQVLSHRGSEVTAVTYASHETSTNGQKAIKQMHECLHLVMVSCTQ
jgi:hypothetical protein